MRYERLTPKDMVITLNRNEQESIETLLRYAYRLHELEDKIENGMIFILPKPIGTRIYEICQSFIYEEEIDAYTITANKKYLRFRSGLFTTDYVEKIGKTIFFTREEAEAKLKELKGE